MLSLHSFWGASINNVKQETGGGGSVVFLENSSRFPQNISQDNSTKLDPSPPPHLKNWNSKTPEKFSNFFWWFGKMKNPKKEKHVWKSISDEKNVYVNMLLNYAVFLFMCSIKQHFPIFMFFFLLNEWIFLFWWFFWGGNLKVFHFNFVVFIDFLFSFFLQFQDFQRFSDKFSIIIQHENFPIN